MKKLIFRNLITDITVFFLISALSISLIIWVIQSVNYLDLVSEDGHSFKVYFFYSALTLPKIFSRIVIFLLFISIFYIISKYEENNEILIFWIHGIKKIEFINNILKFAFIVLLFQLLLTLFIVPKTQDLGRSFIRGSGIDYFPALIKSKQFIDTVSELTIFIEEKNENGELHNIFLKDKFDKDKSQIVSAKRGLIISKDKKFVLILYDGKIVNLDKKNTNVFEFTKSEFNLNKYTTKTTTFPKIQELNTNELINCLNSFYRNNKSYVKRNFVCNQSSINSVSQEIFKRIFGPLYIIIVAFIASCLIMKSKDDFNYSKYKYILFSIGLLGIILSEVSTQYIDYENKLTIIIIATPFIISAFLYFILISKSKLNINKIL